MLFHALTFASSQERCMNASPLGRVLKHRQSEPASVNATKQTCVIAFLANLSSCSQILTENAVKTLKYPLSYTGFL